MSTQNTKNSQFHSEFEEIVVPHKESLRNFALKLTKNEDDAQDLVQETLLKAFRFLDKYERGTNARAWLFMILKNTFINTYRKTSKEPLKVDYDGIQNFYESIKPEDVKYEHTSEDPYSRLLDDDLTQAVSGLQEDYRTVVILSDIEGYTYEEIAEFIDKPVGTVRSRLHRARKMLFTKLFDYAVDKGYVNAEVETVAA